MNKMNLYILHMHPCVQAKYSLSKSGCSRRQRRRHDGFGPPTIGGTIGLVLFIDLLTRAGGNLQQSFGILYILYCEIYSLQLSRQL